MNFICFAGVDLLVPASFPRFLSVRAVREGTFDEEASTLPEQVVARAAGAAGAEHDRWCLS